MNQTFASQLSLKIWKTNVRAQKINGTILEIYRMVVSIFSLSNKDGREIFVEESFLLPDVKPDVVLGILFPTMSNVDVDFQAQDLEEKFYTTGKVLPTTIQVELIRKKNLQQ